MPEKAKASGPCEDEAHFERCGELRVGRNSMLPYSGKYTVGFPSSELEAPCKLLKHSDPEIEDINYESTSE